MELLGYLCENLKLFGYLGGGFNKDFWNFHPEPSWGRFSLTQFDDCAYFFRGVGSTQPPP